MRGVCCCLGERVGAFPGIFISARRHSLPYELPLTILAAAPIWLAWDFMTAFRYLMMSSGSAAFDAYNHRPDVITGRLHRNFLGRSRSTETPSPKRYNGVEGSRENYLVTHIKGNC